jgi:hypothetical protein
MFFATKASMQGPAGFGLRRDAPAFPRDMARLTRLADERLGPAPLAGPVPARLAGFGPEIMAPYMHYREWKRVRVSHRRYDSQVDARADIFHYIECFCNPRRRRKMEALKQTRNLVSADCRIGLSIEE